PPPAGAAEAPAVDPQPRPPHPVEQPRPPARPRRAARRRPLGPAAQPAEQGLAAAHPPRLEDVHRGLAGQLAQAADQLAGVVADPGPRPRRGQAVDEYPHGALPTPAGIPAGSATALASLTGGRGRDASSQ